MQRVSIDFDDTLLYRLEYWSRVFDENRSKGANGYVALGLDFVEANFQILGRDPCPFLFEGLKEYKKLRRAGASNGELEEVIKRMQKGLEPKDRGLRKAEQLPKTEQLPKS